MQEKPSVSAEIVEIFRKINDLSPTGTARSG
jgi:hypothetical protein